MGGVCTEIDSFYLTFLRFDSDGKTSCLLQKCKILYKNTVLLFFKQKLNKYWNNTRGDPDIRGKVLYIFC